MYIWEFYFKEKHYDPAFERHLIGPIGEEDGSYINEFGEKE